MLKIRRFFLNVILVSGCAGLANCAEPAPKQVTDGLAQIANEDAGTRKELLILPKPPVLPETQLPWSSDVQAFTPSDKLDTPEELAIELTRMRARHTPFLADLAPKLQETRITVPITSCDWRLETEQDRRDFQQTLSGQGEWKKVSIPHYDGPVGLATTYYRTAFEVTQEMLNLGAVFVQFKGVDYKAKVFVNGTYIGGHEGFFAPFAFDCTAHVNLGKNTLLVKVENDFVMHNFSSNRGDKIYAFTGPGYDNPKIGWQHCPPAMGIYQSMAIEARPRMQIHDVFVRPLPEESKAEAWIEVFNCDIAERNAIIELAVHGQNFQQTIFTAAMTDGLQTLSSNAKLPTFNENSPKFSKGVNFFRIPFELLGFRSWSPAEPWLYQIHVTLRDSKGKVLDARKRQFGMRSFRMDSSGSPKGRLFLNGQSIKLRGANTMGFEQQNVIRGDIPRLIDDILLAKVCNMNFLRLTQRPVQDEIYEWCDRLGLMTQTDLPLSWVLRKNQFAEAVRQAEEMERLVRAHPCNIMVTYINEPQRNGWGHLHRNLSRPELESFFVAADQVVKFANPDRVIKAIDGDSEPPGPGLPDHHSYAGWYNSNGELGKQLQGYWAHVKSDWLYACGEFGVEGLDSVETMRRRYPAEWLPATVEDERTWNPSSIPKAQTESFHRLWFETPKTLAAWSQASQEHQAQMIRLMTEAFRRDRRMVSCAVHLFIDAFPASWLKTIMDVDRNPKLAFYDYRDALSPIAANLYGAQKAYFSGDKIRIAAWICNDTSQNIEGASVRYQIECQGQVIRTGKTNATVAADDSNFQGWIEADAPKVQKRGSFKVRLGLFDKDGQLIHDTAQDFDLFPPAPAVETQEVLVLGAKNGKGFRLATDLGLKPVFEGSSTARRLIFVDSPTALAATKIDLDAAVQAGARVLCLEWPIGTSTLAGDSIAIIGATDGKRLFVSRDTDHPWVKDFAPNDFKLWYHSKEKGIRPFLSTLFTAPATWKAVLTGGQKDPITGKWGAALAAAEKVQGSGSWIVCQVELAGRIEGNPVARLFAQRLIAQTAQKDGDRAGAQP